jgi:hypothetical protein
LSLERPPINSKRQFLAARLPPPRMRPVINLRRTQHFSAARYESAPDPHLHRTAALGWRRRPVTQVTMVRPFHRGPRPSPPDNCVPWLLTVPTGGNPAVVDRVITATRQDAGGVDVGRRSSATVSRRAAQLTRPFIWPSSVKSTAFSHTRYLDLERSIQQNVWRPSHPTPARLCSALPLRRVFHKSGWWQTNELDAPNAALGQRQTCES